MTGSNGANGSSGSNGDGTGALLRPVTVESTDTAVVLDGLVTYEWAARKRPYLHPVATPSGTVLTRNAPDDHPWHHGLWFTIKFVNGENFWEEYDAYGVLRHTEAPMAFDPEPGRAMLAGELTWIRPDRETAVLREIRSIQYRRLADEAYVLYFSTALVPAVDVVLDRTPFTTWGGYGGLAFRGRGDWHDTRILLDDGVERERTLGEPSAWFALDGPVGEEDRPAGIVIVSSGRNRRHPEPWYASTRAATYGEEGWSNFANAAFLWDGPLELAAGEMLRLDYPVIVHDGIWGRDRIEAAIAAVSRDEFL